MAHIGRLQEKLHEPAKKPRFVKTVWGVGYVIEKSSFDAFTPRRLYTGSISLSAYFFAVLGSMLYFHAISV